MAGLVPAISILLAMHCRVRRDARHKAGHDALGWAKARSAAPTFVLSKVRVGFAALSPPYGRYTSQKTGVAAARVAGA